MELTQYNPVRADIAELAKLNSSLVFDYEKKADNVSARSHIFKLRKKKADVERVRVSAKSEALEFGRKVDLVAKELIGELDDMIDVHQKPLDAIEAREQAIKDAAAKAEANRLAAIAQAEQDRKDAELAAAKAEMEKAVAELAAQRKREHEERIAREAADRARADAERKAEAERQATLQRERDALAAQAKAEREKQEAETRAERAKIEAERRQIEAEKAAIEAKAQAERDAAAAKLKAERDALAAQEKAELDLKEAAERAEREKAEAVERAIVKQRADDDRRRIETETKRRQEEEAERHRAKQKKVRESIIVEMVDSIVGHVPAIADEAARELAVAMLDGKISRVTVDTRKESAALEFASQCPVRTISPGRGMKGK